METNALASSYRDPAGFVYSYNESIYRQVNLAYKENYEALVSSGLFELLAKKKLIVSQEEIKENFLASPLWFTTLKPQQIPFISYAHEWSFDMLKDAALLTLNVCKEALQKGFVLKDATPYNVQFLEGNPIFIDSLSFEVFKETPWIAYRQFCECFLAPLVLMHYTQQPLQALSLSYPEGIPLNIAASLLPFRSKLSVLTYLHIHFHAKTAAKNPSASRRDFKYPSKKLEQLLDSLHLLVSKLKSPYDKSVWSHYYDEASQRENYLVEKESIIRKWITQRKGEFKTGLDLGSNTGHFSKLLAQQNINMVSADFDPACVNLLYEENKHKNSPLILPLVVDASNPSPNYGVNYKERESFTKRIQVDITVALALIHHLAIGKNIPLETVANFLKDISPNLIIEFVPKSDAKVQELLINKKDIYPNYTEENFSKAFCRFYTVAASEKIGTSGRVLYYFKRN